MPALAHSHLPVHTLHSTVLHSILQPTMTFHRVLTLQVVSFAASPQQNSLQHSCLDPVPPLPSSLGPWGSQDCIEGPAGHVLALWTEGRGPCWPCLQKP